MRSHDKNQCLTLNDRGLIDPELVDGQQGNKAKTNVTEPMNIRDKGGGGVSKSKLTTAQYRACPLSFKGEAEEFFDLLPTKVTNETDFSGVN